MNSRVFKAFFLIPVLILLFAGIVNAQSTEEDTPPEVQEKVKNEQISESEDKEKELANEEKIIHLDKEIEEINFMLDKMPVSDPKRAEVEKKKEKLTLKKQKLNNPETIENSDSGNQNNSKKAE